MQFSTELVIGGRLGNGQFGTVFHGTDPVHGAVAVKLLKPEPAETPAEWALRSRGLLKEGQRLKSATHRNVVGVLGVIRHEPTDVLHLVTELCDGGSLDGEYRRGPMPLATVKKILTDVSAGLGHIHSRGMVHRDVKPGNLLKHGNVYKVGDFGLVSDKLLLNYASLQGYLDHLAPEVHRNKVTSARTDIWALGMTAYRLLHGDAFYQEYLQRAPGEIPQLIKQGGFAQQLPWLPHIPEPWRRFLRCALHDDAHRRHSSCHDFAQALVELPIQPAWDCRFAAGSAVWMLTEGNRTVDVSWRVHSPRKHEWWAERTGGGKRTMLIGGQKGVTVSSSAARRDLEAFFVKMAS